MAKAEEVLKKLGITVTEEQSVEDVVTAFEATEKTRYQKLFENEHSNKADELEEKARIKFMATLNNDLKKYGLDPVKLEGKTIKERIAELSEKLKGEYSKPSEIKELQEENIKLKNDFEAAKQDFESKIALTKDEVQKEKNQFIIGQKLSKVFGEIPKEKVVGGLTTGQVKAAEALISANYDLGLDDKGELVVYEKGTKKQPTGKVDGKELILNLSDITNKIIFEDLNLKIQSNGQGTQMKEADPNPKTKTNKAIVNDTSVFDKRLEELRSKQTV